MDARVMPGPAYPQDMSLSHLNTAELVLTATVRLFALEARNEDYGLDWHEGLITVGVLPCAVVAFGVLLGAIVKSAGKRLDIRCPLCSSLGEDEGEILQTISLLQQQHFGEAYALLGKWFPPLEQGAMISPAAHAAFGCAKCGLRVPWRWIDTSMLDYSTAPFSHVRETFVN